MDGRELTDRSPARQSESKYVYMLSTYDVNSMPSLNVIWYCLFGDKLSVVRDLVKSAAFYFSKPKDKEIVASRY